jgi:DNA-binding SARP family transcriptional activator
MWMTRLFSILFAFLFFCNPCISGQEDLLTGLYFSSHEVVQDQRTSLNLSPEKAFRFGGNTALEFDINFRENDGYYGYIFRAIADDETNIDFVSNLASETSNFWLVCKDQTLLSYQWADIPSIGYDRWVRVRIDFDIRNSSIRFSMNGKEQEVSAPWLSSLKTFRLVFGACKLKSFRSTDVCPMSVKNIGLYKEERLYRQWELSRHSRNQVYDKVAQARAEAENPIWLIDQYIKWRKLKDIHVGHLLGIAADTAVSRLFFVNDQTVCWLDVNTLETDSVRKTKGVPYNDTMGKSLVYNPYTDELWSYDFSNPNISRFDFRTSGWSHDRPEMIESGFAHHNKFISPVDSSLVTILGYGYYTYKSIVSHYNTTASQWEQTDRSDQIPPRYLSSAGHLNAYEALVFGGYGSKSGRQELAPGSYYDLYIFDLRTFAFSHLWTLPPQEKPFVPSETLVVNKPEDCFYTLIHRNDSYDSYLQLAQYGIHEPSVVFPGDSIPFKFRDTETWVYLYLNERKSDLIAVVSHNDDIALYAIAYPPLTMEDVLQTPPAAFSAWHIAALALAVLLVLAFVVSGKKKKVFPEGFRLQNGRKSMLNITPLPYIKRKETSAIYLLGEFQVFDKQGKDVSASFSPTLKHLFLFVLLNSADKHKGVSSARLDETLWHDKIGDSARNNRNVNISKLRTLLDETGSIGISNENALWKISIGKTVYCDYFGILDILSASQTEPLAPAELYRLLSLLNSGEFLHTVHAGWAEPYKSAFHGEIAGLLNRLLRSPSMRNNTDICYHIAEYLLSADPLNEDAIRVKCSILNRMGKRSIAKTTYDEFTKEYEKLLGAPYPLTFAEIIR